jgi:hypothetical protein
MPSSRPNTIPTVIHLVRQLKPKSILDVGVGFGKWGHLFREYTDITEAEKEPKRYRRRNWRVRIDGIEGHAAYLTPMHRYLYDKIYVGDARTLIKELPRHDLVFMGDVIEHLGKRDGFRLLRNAVRSANKAVIVTTPKYATGQADLCDNELERHRSLWSAEDFSQFANSTVKAVDRSTLLAIIRKPGAPSLVCTPPRPIKRSDARRLKTCCEQLVQRITQDVPFVLVDEEHIRSELPHSRAIPFLERNGEYWGPPANDAAAVRELERLRKAGARYLAVAWPSFWWFEHYSEFTRHIRRKFRCVLKNDSLVLFTLAA